MSVQAMAWVLECAEDITDPTALLIMLSIANHANEHGENSWPGLNTIAHEARCSRATVQRRLRELSEVGHVVIERNAGGTWDQPANRRPNRYKLAHFQGYGQGSHLVTPQADQGCQTAVQGSQKARSDVSPADTQTVLEPSTKRGRFADEDPPQVAAARVSQQRGMASIDAIDRDFHGVTEVGLSALAQIKARLKGGIEDVA